MKTTSLASLAVLTCSAFALAASDEASSATKQLQIYPKNLARQHVGSNLFLFNATNQTFTPTEAAAAWLDDDITTGWPVLAGKQHYMLALPEPHLLTNFSVSTRPAEGRVTLYAGDEPAPPASKSWTVVAKDIPIESINEHKLSKPFSRFAKYLLIETEIADPGPLFSLYVYGERTAVSYDLRNREQAIDTRSIFGPYVNSQTAFSTSALYAQGRVSYANAGDGSLAWQKAVDDNPESGMTLAPSTTEAGAVVSFGTRRPVSRVAVLADAPAQGRLDFFVPAEGAAAEGAASLEGLTPVGSLNLDGTSARSSVDFAGAEGSQLLVRWTPANGTDSLTVRELNTFGNLSLAQNELASNPATVAESDASDFSKDGKTFKDFKEPIAEGPLEPVASGPGKSPYLPGALGFPPIISSSSTVTSDPDPLSP
jgi:hypothetical protein